MTQGLRKRAPILPGRMGRMRYAAYVMALGLLCGAALSLLLIMAVQIPGASKLTAMRVASFGILYGVLPVGLLYFTTLRSHDFGATGLTALLILVPMFIPMLAPFIAGAFMLWPGQARENHFGSPPPPNGRGLIASTFLLWGGVLLTVFYVWVNGPATAGNQPPMSAELSDFHP